MSTSNDWANVYVQIHGINPGHEWLDYRSEFRAYQTAIEGHLERKFDACVYVDWGQPSQPSPLTSIYKAPLKLDEELLEAKQRVYYKSGMNGVQHAVESHPEDRNEVLLSSPLDMLNPLLGVVRGLKESVILSGFADCAYYCSPDGEGAIRDACYGDFVQGLNAVAQELGDRPVQLHLVSHSLGVTITHDFLYGLFGNPTALAGKRHPLLSTWQDRACAGTLRVASFTSYASQLPIFLLRKQDLLQRIRRGDPIDPREIGVGRDDKLRWQLFYDANDPLGFPTRMLYGKPHAIREYQVNNGFDLDRTDIVHTGYADVVSRNEVFEKTCQLIESTWSS